MYIPKGHEHEIWAATKAAKQAAFKLMMKEFKAMKLSGPAFMFMTFRHVHSTLISVFILTGVVLAPYPLVFVRASELWDGFMHTP